MYLSIIFEFLGLFVNILTAHHKYSLCIRENLKQSIQMLSKKQKTFPRFFGLFLKSNSNLEYAEKNDCYSLCLSEITDCERHDWLNV